MTISFSAMSLMNNVFRHINLLKEFIKLLKSMESLEKLRQLINGDIFCSYFNL